MNVLQTSFFSMRLRNGLFYIIGGSNERIMDPTIPVRITSSTANTFNNLGAIVSQGSKEAVRDE